LPLAQQKVPTRGNFSEWVVAGLPITGLSTQ
jgi:hypothetical protein